jgi:hypothetical protein
MSCDTLVPGGSLDMSSKVQDDIPFQRETVELIDPTDLVALVNVSRDIAVGRKILA